MSKIAPNNKQNIQDINKSNLINVSQMNTKKRLPSTTSVISLAFSFLFIVVIYLFFTFKYTSPINTAIRVNDIKVDNETYEIVKKYVLENNKNNTDEKSIDDFISKYLVDTIILSEKAKELGLEVLEEDYKDLQKIYGRMAERVALRIKLEEFLKQEAENITEQEMKDFYEENKNEYYIKNSSFEFYAVQSDKPMPENYQFDTSKLTLTKGTLMQLRTYGIYLPKKGVNVIESDDGIYRYIIIVNGEVEYIPYEEVKERIKEALYIQKTDGQIQEYLQQGYSTYKIDYFR